MVERSAESGGPPLLGVRRVALWFLRFALAYALLGGALYVSRPVVYPLLGRAARDVTVLTTAAPRISEIRWEGTEFRVHSPLYAGFFGFRAPWIGVALLVPLAFALSIPAVPGRSRWRTCVWIVLAGLCVAPPILANNLSAALAEVLRGQGLVAFGPWRTWTQQAVRDWTWNLCTIVLPAIGCLLIAAPLFGGREGRDRARRARRFGPNARLALGGVAIAIVLAAADVSAMARLERGDDASLRAELERWNPDIGAYYLRVGEQQLAVGQLGLARQHFLLALRYPRYATRADDGLKRVARAWTEGRGPPQAPPSPGEP